MHSKGHVMGSKVTHPTATSTPNEPPSAVAKTMIGIFFQVASKPPSSAQLP
jgi:hypothetical protein